MRRFNVVGNSKTSTNALQTTQFLIGRWSNFKVCPHCQANGRLGSIEGPSDCGHIISRSDGLSFHLVLGDRPIAYPLKREQNGIRMVSVGFWYVHEANSAAMESAVVMLRKVQPFELFAQLEVVADKLYQKLCESSHLSLVYEFDGRNLREVVH